MKMPEKNPDLWALIYNFLAMHSTSIWAFLGAAAVGFMRAYYEGLSKWKGTIGGLICAALGVSIFHLVAAFNMDMPESTPVALACFFSWAGLKRLDNWLDRIADKRLGDEKDEKH